MSPTIIVTGMETALFHSYREYYYEALTDREIEVYLGFNVRTSNLGGMNVLEFSP